VAPDVAPGVGLRAVPDVVPLASASSGLVALRVGPAADLLKGLHAAPDAVALATAGWARGLARPVVPDVDPVARLRAVVLARAGSDRAEAVPVGLVAGPVADLPGAPSGGPPRGLDAVRRARA